IARRYTRCSWPTWMSRSSRAAATRLRCTRAIWTSSMPIPCSKTPMIPGSTWLTNYLRVPSRLLLVKHRREKGTARRAESRLWPPTPMAMPGSGLLRLGCRCSVGEDDLVELGRKRRQAGGRLHVGLGFWIAQHRLEVLPASPLGVVRNVPPVQASMDVRRDVAREVAHDLLGRLDEQV